MANFFNGIWVLSKKEIKDFFVSPLVYILSGVFFLVLGWLFFNYIIAAKDITLGSLSNRVLLPIFGNMNFIFLFFVPLITMKLFSEEKKLGTISLLYQSRLNETQIILGKFLGALFIILFMIALTFLFPAILYFSGYEDWGLVITCYSGLLLSVMCYLAVGLFASSLTENQIISAVVGFAILLGLMLLVVSVRATNIKILGQIASYLAVPYHYEGFVRGAILNYNLVYFVSFIGFFLYLTHRVLCSRKW